MMHTSAEGMRFEYGEDRFSRYFAYFSYGPASIQYSLPKEKWDRMTAKAQSEWRKAKYAEAEAYFKLKRK